jgi:hypothetical protein
MHALSDITVPALSTAEQFLIGVWRCWDVFAERLDPRVARCLLCPAFAYMNMLGAFCAFDRAFDALQANRLRRLRFAEVDCTALESDEARLLCSLACLQRTHTRAAASALSAMVTASGVRAVLPPLARIAGQLELRGHRLPAWAS